MNVVCARSRQWLAMLIGLIVGLVLAAGGASGPAAVAVELPGDRSWPLDDVRVVGPFRAPATGWGPGHRGVDLAARPGTPVRAAAAGTVTVAHTIAGRGVVVVDHGLLRTTYEPVSPLVIEGMRVESGAVIGRIGHGGHCVARCLHWGLIEGRDHYLDPLRFAPGGRSGRVRLLAPDLRREAERRAADRAADLRRATAAAIRQFAAVGPAHGRGDFRHPVPGPVSSGFGMRLHPVLQVWKLHDGTDFGASCGTPIVAAAAGQVSDGGTSRGYGRRLMIDHGRVSGRRVVTGYNHAARYVVGRGERVRGGQLIGYVGRSGYATGCHLHLMVWLDGRLVNPMTWFSL